MSSNALMVFAMFTAVSGLNEVRILEGALLPEAPVFRSHGGSLDVSIVMEPVRLIGPGFDVITRSFNGSLPAPTLAVLPGDQLLINLVNGLGGPTGVHPGSNTYHDVNKTNLHLHGLHISPNAPADDTLGTLLSPGSSWQYKYQILADHSPGTYWFHPHHHGSVLLQAGAGAAGALIVQDPPNFLSKELEGIPEKVLLVQHMAMDKLQEAATASQDNLFRVNRMNGDGALMLVNGAVRPFFTMLPGQWQRLRFIMAGMTQWIIVDFGACEAALLAKDGIYISDFPRSVNRATLPPGGRMDVVVRCPLGEGGAAAEHKITSVDGPMKDGKPVGKVGGSWVGTLFTVKVEGQQDTTAQTLRPWSPARPAYLQDLMSVRSPQPECSCMTIMGTPPGHPSWGKEWINGHLFRHGPTQYIHKTPANVPVERFLVGTDKHIYHQHTYPFQLGEVPSEDPFFRHGDWHDSYLNVWTQNVTIRYTTADWQGPMLLHCHDYTHEEKGMMAVELVGSKTCECNPGYEVDTSSNLDELVNFGQWQSLLRSAPFFGALAMAAVVLFAGALYLGRSCWAARLGMQKCCSRDYQAMPA